MLLLAAPESLTDDLALDLIHHSEIEGIDAGRVIHSLHVCDFIVERNSEWHFAERVRRPLLMLLLQEDHLATRAHKRLVQIAQSSDVQSHLETPLYLVNGPGEAYHQSFLAPSKGLLLYAREALEPLTGQQWLATKLSTEQQQLGVFSSTALEVLFLRGMLLYRERKPREADPLLRRVASSPRRTLEVAIAGHLIGRIDSRRYRTRPKAERELRRSLSILEELGDEFGSAQVLHTLGRLVGRSAKRSKESEKLLRRSLRIEKELNHSFSVAQVLHTLGQLVGRDEHRSSEAEELLRQSLDLGQELHRDSHVAQVLHTLGQLVGRDERRSSEAEELLSDSLSILEELGDRFGSAQVLHTLGRLISHDEERVSDADGMLRRSLSIGEELGKKDHQAQVLYALGKLYRSRDQRQASEFLHRSLAINQRTGNREGQRIVEAELRKIRGRN